MPFIEHPPLRKVIDTGIVGDIESHLPKNHPYKDELVRKYMQEFTTIRGLGVSTRVHEGTHGVNSIIRNGLASEHGKCNAFYLLKNQAFWHPEPNKKLSQIAAAIPHELRGTGYQLYMISQQRWWNDRPLYIVDELIAYTNGTKACVAYNLDETTTTFSCSLLIEFIGYFAILVQEIRDDELRAFMHTRYEDCLNVVSSIFHAGYNVNDLYTQLSVAEQYFDDPIDYIMI
jgi:hypothetical protein